MLSKPRTLTQQMSTRNGTNSTQNWIDWWLGQTPINLSELFRTDKIEQEPSQEM
jgi:hypothetical protein